MKNYRAFKRYTVEEWENDNEWKAKRLDFIWSIRDYNSSLYLDLDLHNEKEDFYSVNNSEVARMASKLHYSVDMDYYEKTIGNTSIENQYSILKNLRKMKRNDIVQFMRKDNCNLYEYLKDKIGDGYFYDVEREDKYNNESI